MSEDAKCPVCEDVLTMTEDGLVCESCDYKEPPDEDKDTPTGSQDESAGAIQVSEDGEGAESSEPESTEAEEGAGEDGLPKAAGADVDGESGPERDLRLPRIDLNKVNPGMQKLNKVTLFGWQVGHARYRYGLNKPPHYKAAFQKEMTGRDAFKTLTQIKNKNRHGRLETKIVIS